MKIEGFLADTEIRDMDVFVKNINVESLRMLWKGKTKVTNIDALDHIASGDWIGGGKELGKSLLRGVSGKTVS